MRRLSAAGAAIVMCLAFGGVPALGQDASEMPSAAPDDAMSEAPLAMDPVVFTGTLTCGLGTSEWLADDPRVTGPCSLTMDHENSGDIPGGFVATGDYARAAAPVASHVTCASCALR